MKKFTGISQEGILLLSLCRLTFTEENKRDVYEAAATVTDWSHFASLANEHGVAALTGYNIMNTFPETHIPEIILSYLKNAHLKNIARNTFLASTIAETLEILNRKKIKTVLLKGLALEITDYGNAGLRQMSDVDVLISAGECLEAWNLLIDNGFVSLPVKSSLHKPILIYLGKHLPSLLKNGASVEIHHDLFGGDDNYLTNIVIKESVEASLNNQTVYVPEPQLFFLYLVRHLHRHELLNESQLRLYTDLYLLCSNHFEQIINDNLIVTAEKAGLTTQLAGKLAVIQEFWGLSYPEKINDFIQKYYDKNSINKFLFFLNNPKKNQRTNKALTYKQIVKDIPGINRKIRFIAGDIFPSIGFIKNRYKCRNTFTALFYYPARIGKLLFLFKASGTNK